MECFPRSVDILVVFLLSCCLRAVLASDGDRSPFYQNCLNTCAAKNCSIGERFYKDVENSWLNQVTAWRCSDECRYWCMWRTVTIFQERRWGLPKFHGKWPFIRVFGMQELGSVIGSILNLVSHLFMYNKMQATFSSYSTPLLWMWRAFALVCVHGWVWSTIFHTRDTSFTEFMDYACALSMVMIFFVTCVLRLSYGASRLVGLLVVWTTLLYYAAHVRYLYSGNIDYEYNMMANIVPGAVAMLLWSAWGAWRHRRFPHTRHLLAFNMLSALFMALELLDFPPYLYVWDAHALWHLSTSCLPLLFYRFVFEDLVYLRKSWPMYEEKSAIKIF